MSLREEMWKYEQITGESAEHVPIIKLGAFLDGYEMGLKALEQQPSEDCVARSEALDILDDFEEDVENGKFKTAYAKARERMCELPPVTPSYNSIKTELKPSDDCISREEVLDILKDKWNMFSDANDAMQESIDTIEALPPVTPTSDAEDKYDLGYNCGYADAMLMLC